MTTCDWCDTLLPLSDLFNVEYLDANLDPNGFANVLCPDCLQDAFVLFGEELVEAWN